MDTWAENLREKLYDSCKASLWAGLAASFQKFKFKVKFVAFQRRNLNPIKRNDRTNSAQKLHVRIKDLINQIINMEGKCRGLGAEVLQFCEKATRIIEFASQR